MTRGTRKRPKRTRRATGVYQDAHGFSVKYGSKGHEHRYPLGTPLATLTGKYRELRAAAMMARTTTPRRPSHTFGRDCQAYLATLPDGPRRRDDAALLRHWIAVFGDVRTDSLTSQQIATQLAAWATTPLPLPRVPGQPPIVPSAATRQHLRRVLSAVFRALNGRAGANPVRDVPAIRVRYDDARALPEAVIDAIFQALPDQGRPQDAGDGTRPTISLTKLRLAVIRETGLPPALLRQMRAADVDLEAATMHVPARAKGRGVPGQQLRMTARAVAAFRALLAAGGLTPFNVRSMAKSWARAVTRARKAQPDLPWPATLRAYDLRHTFGTRVYAASGDLRLTAEMLRHSALATTRRYSRGGVSARVDALITTLDASRPLPDIARKGVEQSDANGSIPHHGRAAGRTAKTGPKRKEKAK